jgi:hypothetical protein
MTTEDSFKLNQYLQQLSSPFKNIILMHFRLCSLPDQYDIDDNHSNVVMIGKYLQRMQNNTTKSF